MQHFTPKQYLAIDISNNFQGDKLDWEDRIQWVADNDHQLEALLNQAEEPALYHAGVQAYRKAQRGEATGYPISLDACASGLQILSVLIGCEKSALQCGVLSTGHREDPYTNLYRVLCDKMGNAARIERKDTKRAIMTALYSSTAVPKEVFGEGEQLAAFYKVMEEEIPGAWQLNLAMKQLWNPNALAHEWIMPDNFHVKVKVMAAEAQYVQFMDAPHEVRILVNKPQEEGRSLPANITHSVDGFIVREMVARCNFDSEIVNNVRAAIGSKGTRTDRAKDKMVITLWNHFLNSGYLSVRILQYLDAENIDLTNQVMIVDLLKSLPKKNFPLITIHDCFRCHPNYGNDLRTQYNLILSHIARSNMLSFIASAVAGKYIHVEKLGDISKQILEADYALS